MGIKHALTRVLMNWLPPDDQEQMVADLIARLYADLPPARQQEKIEWLGPRLMAMIREGRFGLPLLVYYHLLRLLPLRWLESWVKPVDAPPEGQLARLVAGGTGATSALA